MSETPMKLIVDCSTGDVTEVPLTPEEIAEQRAAAEAFAQEQAAREAAEAVAAEAKASAIEKLAALGLSDAEISALVG